MASREIVFDSDPDTDCKRNGYSHVDHEKLQVFKCPENECCKSYNRKDNLLQHLKRDHQIPATKSGRFKCHIHDCQQCYFHRTELIKHLQTEHSIHIAQETKEFNSWTEFESWKDQEEESLHYYFVQPTGEKQRTNEEKRIVVYTCCRDGGYRGCTKQCKTDKQRSSKESRKLTPEKFCLASITATENLVSGKVTVCYTATHTNHQLNLKECKHLPLPKAVIERVKTMLANGVEMETIMDGCPVAWLISNREDEATLTMFFKVVHERCPKAKITNLMTDDDLAGVNGCSTVYPGVRHLLCKWHIDRAWQRKLKALVKDSEQKANLYACLWILMNEEDSDTFKDKEETFTTYWSTRQPKFIEYYNNEYRSRAEKWAMCYRHFDHQSTDTNMLVESFHNKLKMNPRYLAHQVNKRIDDLVGTLLQIEEDLFFDRMRKEVMRDSSEVSLKQEGTDRHTRGMEIPDESIQMVSEDIFKVVSTSREKEYTIHVYAEQCALGSKCVPHCIAPECSHLCRCIMECSCIDYKCGHICKHTHKVRALVVNTQVEDLKPINHQSIIEDEPTETTETSTVYMCTPSQDK
ncbi:uncharacterized protein [Dysidea avara]|uniref:uncharacterized protein isoform X2 n=1 Tax=Dysidea avara TaxID=196820 RepID=UPI003331F739